MSATDKDISRQSNFRYFLSGDGTDTVDPTFTIESDTGRIFLHKKLDRDLPNGREVYQFNVQAEDEPGMPDSLFGYAYVKVKPKDINDNSPVFVQSDLHGSVPEHSPAGTQLSLRWLGKCLGSLFPSPSPLSVSFILYVCLCLSPSVSVSQFLSSVLWACILVQFELSLNYLENNLIPGIVSYIDD